jgi:membrane dipeptidase
VKKVGVDHVGIASDFGGGGGIVGWKDASETYNVTRELARRGYSEEDIAKLWGGNLLRVLARVKEIAKETRR